MDFNPDFTIISAGFDAARGDPLGCCDVRIFLVSTSLIMYSFLPLICCLCYFVLPFGSSLQVTPAGYASMTQMLSALSGGKLLVILEGGSVSSLCSFVLALKSKGTGGLYVCLCLNDYVLQLQSSLNFIISYSSD